MPSPLAFATATDLRKWLEAHHETDAVLMLRCYKVHARHKGIGYQQGLEEALCFGWIDGVRRPLDSDSFVVRFTPRNPKSKWSAVNVRHFNRLKSEGRVHAAGDAAFDRRDKKQKPVSTATRPSQLAPELAAEFKKNARAWEFFSSKPPGYQRLCTFFVMEAKKPETRQKRLATLIACSAAGKSLPGLER
jgi:uncharacterized protein YdeI (YjbR/CyaY-like superfamily)